eukprot:CAMPEP_0179056666 /NCGR_PEP_ID=MMETSP0796-20121207/23930_1 /TAXON_ID=73915 /ORGANISM="Pyrodinium bahamense, Strain pbaha01" /LENGTH=134 /DNA_ID=CAMNT_0020753349 /DNA_START=165 /DNA_END=569 /DNA_ORIENTATION=+
MLPDVLESLHCVDDICVAPIEKLIGKGLVAIGGRNDGVIENLREGLEGRNQLDQAPGVVQAAVERKARHAFCARQKVAEDHVEIRDALNLGPVCPAAVGLHVLELRHEVRHTHEHTRVVRDACVRVWHVGLKLV